MSKHLRKMGEVALPQQGEHYTAADGTGSTVMDDNFDPNYMPPEDEVKEYAKWLEIDWETEGEDLKWIAIEGLKAPLPKEWKPCKTDDGTVYYFNFKTGDSLWDHPCDEVYKDKVKREREILREKKEKSKNAEKVVTESSLMDGVEFTATGSELEMIPEVLTVLDSPDASAAEKLSALTGISKERLENDSLFLKSHWNDFLTTLVTINGLVKQSSLMHGSLFSKDERAAIEAAMKNNMSLINSHVHKYTEKILRCKKRYYLRSDEESESLLRKHGWDVDRVRESIQLKQNIPLIEHAQLREVFFSFLDTSETLSLRVVNGVMCNDIDHFAAESAVEHVAFMMQDYRGTPSTKDEPAPTFSHGIGSSNRPNYLQDPTAWNDSEPKALREHFKLGNLLISSSDSDSDTDTGSEGSYSGKNKKSTKGEKVDEKNEDTAEGKGNSSEIPKDQMKPPAAYPWVYPNSYFHPKRCPVFIDEHNQYALKNTAQISVLGSDKADPIPFVFKRQLPQKWRSFSWSKRNQFSSNESGEGTFNNNVYCCSICDTIRPFTYGCYAAQISGTWIDQDRETPPAAQSDEETKRAFLMCPWCARHVRRYSIAVSLDGSVEEKDHMIEELDSERKLPPISPHLGFIFLSLTELLLQDRSGGAYGPLFEEFNRKLLDRLELGTEYCVDNRETTTSPTKSSQIADNLALYEPQVIPPRLAYRQDVDDDDEADGLINEEGYLLQEMSRREVSRGWVPPPFNRETLVLSLSYHGAPFRFWSFFNILITSNDLGEFPRERPDWNKKGNGKIKKIDRSGRAEPIFPLVSTLVLPNCVPASLKGSFPLAVDDTSSLLANHRARVFCKVVPLPNHADRMLQAYASASPSRTNTQEAEDFSEARTVSTQTLLQHKDSGVPWFGTLSLVGFHALVAGDADSIAVSWDYSHPLFSTIRRFSFAEPSENATTCHFKQNYSVKLPDCLPNVEHLEGIPVAVDAKKFVLCGRTFPNMKILRGAGFRFLSSTLKKVVLNLPSLSKISESFLESCHGLRDVDLTDCRSLEVIEDLFCSKCPALKKVKLTGCLNLQEIGNNCLSNCPALQTILLPGASSGEYTTTTTSTTSTGGDLAVGMGRSDTDVYTSKSADEERSARDAKVTNEEGKKEEAKENSSRDVPLLVKIGFAFAENCPLLKVIDWAACTNLKSIGRGCFAVTSRASGASSFRAKSRLTRLDLSTFTQLEPPEQNSSALSFLSSNNLEKLAENGLQVILPSHLESELSVARNRSKGAAQDSSSRVTSSSLDPRSFQSLLAPADRDEDLKFGKFEKESEGIIFRSAAPLFAPPSPGKVEDEDAGRLGVTVSNAPFDEVVEADLVM